MKKLLFILSYVLVSNVSIAQHTAQFCTQTDSTNWGGGYFCNVGDSLTFYDHSYGDIVLWQWTFHGAIDSILSYTTYQPTVGAKWASDGYYRVTLATVDSFGQWCTIDVGIHLNQATVNLNQADTIYLPVGDSIALTAIATTGSYFKWRNPNGVWSNYSLTDSTRMVSDTGTYVVSTGHGYCESSDVVVIVRPIVNITTSIETQTNNSLHFALYPNPATDQIVVESGKTDTYKILDITGKTVIAGKIVGKEVVNILELNTGIYFFVSGDTARKFIVQH